MIETDSHGYDADMAAAGLAQLAAEAIRQLNHATIRGQGYQWPSDIDDVVAELFRAAFGMVQALDQARGWLTRAQAAGKVGHDQCGQHGQAPGGDEAAGLIAEFVAEASARLAGAARQAAGLGSELGAARALTSHLTGR